MIRCRNCRHVIYNITSEIGLLDSHSRKLSKEHDTGKLTCDSYRNEIYISEDRYPDWILTEIENSLWTKGKLKCPSCVSRIGSFDFVSRKLCFCKQQVLPSVHLVNSKVDYQI